MKPKSATEILAHMKRNPFVISEPEDQRPSERRKSLKKRLAVMQEDMDKA